MQLNVEDPVVVMFVTTNGLVSGISGFFAGRTIAQMRAEVRNGLPKGRFAYELTPAFINGRPVSKVSERAVHVCSGDELWFGWKPPD